MRKRWLGALVSFTVLATMTVAAPAASAADAGSRPRADITENTTVTDTEMQSVYDQIKTPYNWGKIDFEGFDETYEKDGKTLNKTIDCVGVFKEGDKWYMTFVVHMNRSDKDAVSKTGYTTHIASSDDLLHWTYEGQIFGNEGTRKQSDAFPALQNTDFNGDYTLQKVSGTNNPDLDGKYLLTTMEGTQWGYETTPMSIGLVSFDSASKRDSFKSVNPSILSAKDENAAWGERFEDNANNMRRGTLYKSNIIDAGDEGKSLTGYRYIIYYNAIRGGADKKDPEKSPFYNGNEFKATPVERMFMAGSNDLTNWTRIVSKNDGTDKVNRGAVLVETDVKGGAFRITGDPQVFKVGNLWVMNYYAFEQNSKAGSDSLSNKIHDNFAVSKDLMNWKVWTGENGEGGSTSNISNNPYEFNSAAAGKPWIVRDPDTGIVYHFTTTSSTKEDTMGYGSGFGVMTSVDLRAQYPDDEAAQKGALAAKYYAKDNAVASKMVDSVTPDKGAAGGSEKSHNLRTSGKSSTGTYEGKVFRNASAGGWFSYDLEVDGSGSNFLNVTYTHADSAVKPFDIYVGDTLAVKGETIKPADESGEKFYTETYDISAIAAQKAKEGKVTVRFVPDASSSVGVYYVGIDRYAGDYQYSTDAAIKALSVEGGTVSPAVSDDVTSYTVRLDTKQDVVNVTITPKSDVAQIKVVKDGEEILIDDSKPYPVALNAEGDTTLTFKSFAEDWKTSKTYTVTFTAPWATVDKTNLQEALSKANALTEQGEYTDATWNAFVNARTAAQQVMDNASATVSEVEQATETLTAAQAALAKDGNSSDASKGDKDSTSTPADNGSSDKETKTNPVDDTEKLSDTGISIIGLAMAALIVSVIGIAMSVYRKRG